MPNILLTTHYSQKPLTILQSFIPDNFSLITLDNITQENLLEKCEVADYLLVSGRLKINAILLKKMNNLKMIQRTGVGLDSMDLEEIKNRNIPLYVNAGINADSVAEHALMLILAGLRRVNIIDSDMKKNVWDKQEQGLQTRTLKGRKIGIIGMGNIGKKVSVLLRGFETEIIYYDKKRLNIEEEIKLGVKYCNLSELIRNSEIITLHCPATKELTHLICEKNIEHMKDGVIIVNTARGQLICEEDLIQALNSGKVGYAGLDVFEKEPLNKRELSSLKNVILTPHIAGVTYDAFYQMMHDAIRNICFFEEGRRKEIEQYRLL